MNKHFHNKNPLQKNLFRLPENQNIIKLRFSLSYNYLDYRFKNTTDNIYQLCIYVTENELCGELRAEVLPEFEYEIRTENERFVREKGEVYRTGNVYRKCLNRNTCEILWDKCIRENHARVMYDTDNLTITDK